MAFRKDNNTNKPKSFTKIAIGLASPEEILERSSGAGIETGDDQLSYLQARTRRFVLRTYLRSGEGLRMPLR